ncbi:tail protein X [Antarcticirhabdus aurantiaca]
MADSYTMRQGQTVDQVCREIYGDESGFVEAVLGANPGLAAKGFFPGLGTVIVVPDLALADEGPAPVTLWD